MLCKVEIKPESNDLQITKAMYFSQNYLTWNKKVQQKPEKSILEMQTFSETKEGWGLPIYIKLDLKNVERFQNNAPENKMKVFI